MPKNPDWTRDELILALDLYLRANGPHLQAHHAEVVQLSELLNALPVHDLNSRGVNFRNPNGVAMKLGNFMRFDPNSPASGLPRGNRLEEQIWQEFANDIYRLRKTAEAIRDAALRHVAEERAVYSTEDSEEEFPEGRILTRLHKEKERNTKLVERKKLSVLNGTGRLQCEACDFDFRNVYGDLGRDYAECHHRIPIADLTENHRTRLSDVAIVCANCHRMLHRSRPMLTVEQLRAVIEQNRVKSLRV